MALLRRGVADAVGQGRREFAALGYTALVKAARRLGRDADVRRSRRRRTGPDPETDLRSHGFTLEAHLYQMLAQGGGGTRPRRASRHLLDIAPDAASSAGRPSPPRQAADASRAPGRGRAARAGLGARPSRPTSSRCWCPPGRPHRGAPGSGATRSRVGTAPSCSSPAPTGPGGPLPPRVLRYAARCGWSLGEPAGCRPEHLLGLRGDWEGVGTGVAAHRRPLRAGLGARRVRAAGAHPGGPRRARRPRGRPRRPAGARPAPRARGGEGAARPTPGHRAHPAGLTERQVDVLRMLGDGLTNAEIAAKLVVSVRTVDHHVSAILMKLGVSGRRDAAHIARELV